MLDEIETWPGCSISFDDGNSSDVEIALDALLARNLSATFFVVAGRFDIDGSLDRDDVRALRRAGMTIGTHGMGHRSWRQLGAADVQAELVDARAEIAEAAGAPVDEASAPLGAYDRRLIAELRSLGYTRLHTSDRRTARPGAWLQPRFSARTGESPADLVAEVRRSQATGRRVLLEAKGLAKRLR